MSGGNARPSLREAVDAALNNRLTHLEDTVTAPPLEGVKTPAGKWVGRRARMRTLEDAHGGPRGAAAAVGVQYRTWMSWKVPVARPRPASLAMLDDAYQAVLLQRAQTPRRIRAEARRQFMATTQGRPTVWAEVQWEGYYNGQKTNSPKTEPYEPLKGNGQAYRKDGLAFGKDGPLDLAPVLSAWDDGEDTGAALEAVLTEAFVHPQLDYKIFCNTYRHGAKVEITWEG